MESCIPDTDRYTVPPDVDVGHNTLGNQFNGRAALAAAAAAASASFGHRRGKRPNYCPRNTVCLPW